jgi:simple sugar transport system permease protein
MKNESPLLKLMQKDGAKTVLSSLISILIGLVFGAVLVVIVACTSEAIPAKGGWEGVQLVIMGLFSKGRDAVGNLVFGWNAKNFGNMLFRATPLLMTGLSVAVANKTGLFNIGASGQYLMGTWATLTVALTLPTNVIPAWLVWILAFLAGMLAGALWGAIPGILKATRNINEVLACIMTNWIAANLVTMLFSNSDLRNAEVGGKIGYIKPTVDNGVATAKLGLDKLTDNSQINAGILVAIGIAILIYILMNKTTLGYELKACGSNRHAARYAGINDKRNIVLSMAIAGALSGGGAALYWLSGNTEFYWSTYQALPAEGFNGIPVALLAANSPIGVIFSSIFMSLLNINGLQLKTLTAYNEFITDIIIAAIVYLSSFSLIIKMWLTQKKKKETVQTPAPKADDAGKEE